MKYDSQGEMMKAILPASEDHEMRFKLRPEYGCSPLWEIGTDSTRNVPISELEVDDALRIAIEKWDQLFQNTLDTNYPPDSGFSNPNEAEAFLSEGEVLASALREILENVEYVRVSVQ